MGGERRLTPGQSETTRFPVVGERQSSPLTLADWRLSVTGLVAQPLALAFDDISRLPRVERVWDTICVTGWTHLNHRWGGVLFSTLLDLAGPSPAARFARFIAHSPRDHDTSLPLDYARAHVLLEAMFWWPVWSLRYSTRDFDRLEARMFDILASGLAGPGRGWEPRSLDQRGWRSADDVDRETADAFLRSATVMINQRGYRGASVNRIAAALNVTKGSFYHHHSASAPV